MHPELAIVGRSWVEVGLARPGDPENIAERLMSVSLLHIMQIEPLESVVPPLAIDSGCTFPLSDREVSLAPEEIP